MNLKAIRLTLTLLSPLALPAAAHAVAHLPTIVQSAMSSGPSAPITLTLTAPPTPGNMLFAVVGFGIYGDRNFNPPDTSWTCTLGTGGSVHINTCSHVVVAGDPASYTFAPTSTDGPGVQGVLLEASGVIGAQLAYSYTGGDLGYLSTTASPTLTPAVFGTIPVAVTSGGDPSSPGQSGWSTLFSAPLLGVFRADAYTTDTVTPIATTFNYINNNGHNSLQELLLLIPGAFAAAPAANLPAGNYATAQHIALSDSLPGAVIHYTLDGAAPTCASPVYASPIAILTTTTLSSIACATGYANSAIQTATYVIGSGTLTGISLGAMADLHGFVPFAGDLFHQNIAAAPVDPNSANIVAGIGANHIHHDWSSVSGGNYGIPYIVVDSSVTPLVPFLNQLYSDESDLTLYPIPANLPIESTPPTCTITGDNHAIILDKATGVDYEFYRAQHCPGTASEWQAANGVLWDMTTIEKRPYAYTSVDAAGLSVFEGLIRYDEIAAGAINHAIRFTTSLTRCDHYSNGDPIGAFVLPATHAACNNSGTLNIMGMRIRLKASFDISGYSATNQIILTAMKNYGMILADNGSSLFYQGTPDTRWDDDDLVALDRVGSSDFEVVQMPAVYTNESHPTGPAPVIAALAPASPTIVAGQSVTLNAAVTGASYSYIDHAGFMRNSAMTVSPAQTTTYTLTSRNAFGSTSASTTVNVIPAPYRDPGLTLTPISTRTTTDLPFPVSAHSLSSGQISYSVLSGPATLSGNIASVSGAGTVVLQASQVAQGLYTAATATTTFQVDGIAPNLVFTPIPDQTYGALPFPVAAHSTSSATIVYTVLSGPATLSGHTLTLNGVGVVSLQASQPAAGRYSGAIAQISFTVKPEAAQLAFTPILPRVYGAAPFTLSSTSNSSGGDAYSVVSGPASVEGNTVTINGAGRVVVMVSQVAAGNYAAATATTAFTVSQAVPQLVFAPLQQTLLYGAAPFAVSASSASSGTITYLVAGGPATMSANTLSINGAGTITLVAGQAATANYTAAYATVSFLVRPRHPSVVLQLSAPEVISLSPATFTVQLTGLGRAYPTGVVEILDGSRILGLYPIRTADGGSLHGLVPSILTLGQHNLTAVYCGDANYESSISSPVPLIVRPKPARLTR